jgi:hypothetical protein
MKYRKLRIAWSVGCGILCLLLVVLWVRSYWWESIANPVVTSRVPSMVNGQLVYNDVRARLNRFEPDPLVTHFLPSIVTFSYNGFTIRGISAVIPPWLFVPLSALVAVVPWIRWRFNLRTLLIGMTVVAALLGLVIWAAK